MLRMKKSHAFAQPNFNESFAVNSTQFVSANKQPSVIDIAIRLGRVEQILADNRAALQGGVR